MKLNLKNVRKYGLSSAIFALIYSIMLRFKVQMDLLIFIRLVCLLFLLFFVLTMAFDLIVQLIKKLAAKK